MQINKTILAIDPGEKNIGLALYKPKMGVESVPGFQYETMFDLEKKLDSVIQDYAVEVLVVGDMGLEQVPADLKKVLDRLVGKNKIQMELAGEFLSTFQAEHDLSKQQGALSDLEFHSQSAVNILNDYIDL